VIFLQEPQHCWILHSLPEILLNYVLLIPEIQHLTLHNASWFVSIDKLFEQLNVPADLQAILIRPCLLYLSVGKFKLFNRLLYDLLDNSGINYVALFCTRSSLSMSVFLLGYHTLLAYSKCDLTNDLYKITKQFLEM